MEPRDPTTNLVYLRARDYSAGTGRFNTRDTLNPNGPGTQGFNSYAYASGNPTTFTDPSGHSAFEGSTSLAMGTSSILLYSFVFGVAVAGGAALFGTGALTAFVFFIVAVILFSLLLHASQDFNCRTHGISPDECFAGAAEGRGTININPGSSSFKIAGVVSAVGSCAARLIAMHYNAPLLFNACPGIPKPGSSDGNDPGNDPCDGPDHLQDIFDLLGDIIDLTDAVVTPPGPEPLPRLPQDEFVNSTAPPVGTSTTIGKSSTQNGIADAVVDRLKGAGATDIRVNQHMVSIGPFRVGINRPDIQFTYNGQRYYIELDSPGSSRATGHARRISANDPDGIVFCKTIG